MKYSVHVHKSIRGNVLIIPFGIDKNRIRRALNFPKQLENIHDSNELGLAVRESFLVSEKSPVIEDIKSLPNVYRDATGIISWAKFAKEHFVVACSWDPERGYTFEPWERQKDNSYMPRKIRNIIEIGLGSTNEEIGEAIIKAFSLLE